MTIPLDPRVKRNSPKTTALCLIFLLWNATSDKVYSLSSSTPAAATVVKYSVEPDWSDLPFRAALTYVDDQGLVNYRALLNDRAHLDSFMRQAGSLDRADFEGWDTKEKIAFWINVYNAATLQAILDHYPIRSSFLGRLVYPENSIRQIKGVWSDRTFPVMGMPHTLDRIEHEILRKQFDEPRIHFALVCAAKSCPSLRNEPYEGINLDNQLDDQAARFLARPDAFRVSGNERRIYLSKIFDWYAEDFSAALPASKAFSAYGQPTAGVLTYITLILDTRNSELLQSEGFKVTYIDYDWALNEQGDE